MEERLESAGGDDTAVPAAASATAADGWRGKASLPAAAARGLVSTLAGTLAEETLETEWEQLTRGHEEHF
jgi:hypothetical protein